MATEIPAERPVEADVRVRGLAGELVFAPCLERRSRAEVFGFRQSAWLAERRYLLANHAGLHPAEDPFDAEALHFACRLNGEVVAACRWSPRGALGFEAERACALPAETLAEPERLLQVSRVVVREDLRRRQVSELLLLLCCRHLLAHGTYERWFALCAPRLAQHYVRFGAQEVAGFEVQLAQRDGNVYRLVRGGLASSVERIGRSLAELGPACPWMLDGIATTSAAVAP